MSTAEYQKKYRLKVKNIRNFSTDAVMGFEIWIKRWFMQMRDRTTYIVISKEDDFIYKFPIIRRMRKIHPCINEAFLMLPYIDRGRGPIYTVGEAAILCSVKEETLRRYGAAGSIVFNDDTGLCSPESIIKHCHGRFSPAPVVSPPINPYIDS